MSSSLPTAADLGLKVESRVADPSTMDLGRDAHALPMVVRDDNLRLIGAFVDLVITLSMVGAAMGVMALTLDSGSGNSIVPPLLILVAFWALDVVLYALPIHRWGWSVGNLLTRRRVVDARSGELLAMSRAVHRYFARRNVPRWLWNSRAREVDPFAEPLGYLPGNPVGGVPGIGAVLVAAAQSIAPSDPTGPTQSHADRRVGSAVVRSRPQSDVWTCYTSEAITSPS